MTALFLIAVFVAATGLGYKVISHVPSLLHTPLMSGMNALSGVIILGAIAAAAASSSTGGSLLACLAIVLAMLNLVGGFAVTGRMLKMFNNKDRAEDKS